MTQIACCPIYPKAGKYITLLGHLGITRRKLALKKVSGGSVMKLRQLLLGGERRFGVAKAIKEEIIGVADVTLTGSGQSKPQADQRNIAQKWVMDNVFVGTAWNENQFVQRMGQFEKSASTLNLHYAFYFPDSDMTVIVSSVKKTVAIWRFGKVTQ